MANHPVAAERRRSPGTPGPSGPPAVPALRAALRCCWALPLAAAQQLLALAGPDGSERAAGGFGELALAAQRQVGDVASSLFESADQAQRQAVDRLFDLLAPPTEASRRARREWLAWAASSAAAGRHLLPSWESAMAWVELRNKLQAYWLVRRGVGGPAIGEPVDPAGAGGSAPSGAGDWRGAVARALERQPYDALFTLEGLGHDLAEAVFAGESGGGPRAGDSVGGGPGIAGRSAAAAGAGSDGILAAQASRLPGRSLILLHAGMGMAFAQRACRPLAEWTPAAAVDAALAELIDRCRGHAAPGYLAATVEPLGLVVRTFQPRLMRLVDRGLRRLGGDAGDPGDAADRGRSGAPDRPGRHGAPGGPDRPCDLVRWFWHGAGRAIYFLPLHAFPGSSAAGAALCRCEAPDGTALLDALSGLYYAAAMTNLSHPGVLAALAAEVGDRQPEAEALANGFAAAVLARRETTPDDPAIPALLAWRPAGEAARRLWERQVAAPCREALERLYPLLAAAGGWDALACHRRLPELADRLGAPRRPWPPAMPASGAGAEAAA